MIVRSIYFVEAKAAVRRLIHRDCQVSFPAVRYWLSCGRYDLVHVTVDISCHYDSLINQQLHERIVRGRTNCNLVGGETMLGCESRTLSQ